MKANFLRYRAPKIGLCRYAFAHLYYSARIVQVPQKLQKFYKNAKDSNLITQMILL